MNKAVQRRLNCGSRIFYTGGRGHNASSKMTTT